jgi:protein O-mannosyl-transferase
MTVAPASQQSPRWMRLLVPIVLAAALAGATVAVYWSAHTFELLGYDDRDDVKNEHISNGLTLDTVKWAWTSHERANWYPLTRLSLALDFNWATEAAARGDFQPASAIVHWTNVGLHAANAVLLFVVLLILTRRPWAAAVVAGLFALHPLHVESVAWATERKDVLSTLFWLLTMLAYVGYARRPGVWRYVPVFLMLALGLMAKPMLVTLPFVLLLMDWWPLRRLCFGSGIGPENAGCHAERSEASRIAAGLDSSPPPAGAQNDKSGPGTSFARLALEKLPFLALAIASSIVTYVVQSGGGAMIFADKLSLLSRLAYVPVAYVTYLVRTFWPADLAVFYPYPPEVPLWQTLGAAAILVVITTLVVWQVRRRPYLAFGWFWYVGTLVPVIGLVQVGEQSTADRYTYVPLIGIFIMVVWGAADLAALLWRRWLVIATAGTAAAGVLVGCTLVTLQQLPYWADTITLFNHDIQVVGPTSIAYYNIGDILLLKGELPGAAENYRKALVQQYENSGVHNNLGWVLQRQAKQALASAAMTDNPETSRALCDQASQWLNEAIRHFEAAQRIEPKSPGAYNNMGLIYLDHGPVDRAIEQFQKAIDVAPDFGVARVNLGLAWSKKGRLDMAIETLQDALAAAPPLMPALQTQAHMWLGASLFRMGRYQEALDHYQAALQLAPGSQDVLIRLARLRATAADPAFRNGAEAVRLAEQVCSGAVQVDPLMALDTLAAAYAEAKRFDRAVSVSQKALELATRGGSPQMVAEVKAHLEAYQKNRSVIEQPSPGGATP